MSRKRARNGLAGLFLVLLLSFVFAADDKNELYRIQISNATNGKIEISKDLGLSWEAVGRVIYPVEKVNRKGFTASKWVLPGEVAASAVNAIHIKTEEPQTIFSILPKNFLDVPAGYNSYLSPNSSLCTDISAGKSIFGGGYSPMVGNKVFYFNKQVDATPKAGDVIVIKVIKPAKWPKDIIFENKFGGKITARYFDKEDEIIGEVLRPVIGVGRFAGSRYVSAGRIRANHPGVIDVSTSVGDKVGGFQIIPANHAQSPEMGGARTQTQWMVVGPPKVDGKMLEGVSPLFKYFLKPSYDENNISSLEWENKLLSHFIVEIKLKNKADWRPMLIYTLNAEEDLPEEANKALENVTDIRILFPLK
ncbi:MAG: hypothetical protein FD145_1455 [Candidatus Saganbacteria bacterium]|uniref:Uncharacterized protein n=1 Tax=Candidatus Saganbacteria bacterium TaxID=2575572 RepID=A0A833NWF7_UNCSA|nr:MAG: hypothetical protein FD145_1455 [Candidatus Saganbacteria bacterium]